MTSNLNVSNDFNLIQLADRKPGKLKGFPEKLVHLREISDDLWRATATINIALSALDCVEEQLEEIKEQELARENEGSNTPLGIGYVARLNAILKESSFQDVNMLKGTNDLQFLTESDMVGSSKVMSVQTAHSHNLSLESGPFIISKDKDTGNVFITVEAGHNPSTAISSIKYIRVAMRRKGEERRIISQNMAWTRTTKAICAVLGAALKANYHELPDFPVKFDGNTMTILASNDVEIEAVSLQGTRAGALSPLKACLVSDQPDYEGVCAAVEVAKNAIEEARTSFQQHNDDIANMEALVNSIMERVALLSFMPSSNAGEAETLHALTATQAHMNKGFKIESGKAEILRLMATNTDEAS